MVHKTTCELSLAPFDLFYSFFEFIYRGFIICIMVAREHSNVDNLLSRQIYNTSIHSDAHVFVLFTDCSYL